MERGKVKWFNEGKGYGFVESKGKSYFVHFTEIIAEGYKTLQEGAEVEFTPATSAKGEIATSVKAV